MAVDREQAQAYYEDFSLAIGQRDWLDPNLRHEQLKLLIAGLLGGRRGLRIADVGCGAGVMTDHLARYGTVVGVDFSTAAINAAQRFSRRATFRAGGLEALPGGVYDLITLFDVLEHIPASERPALLEDVAVRLADDGLVFCSTPYPEATRHKAETGQHLQIIDEQVQLCEVVAEAARVGLQLVQYSAYDVWAGSPEYQAMVFTRARSFGGQPALKPARLARRERVVNRREHRHARRLVNAARALRHGDIETARWFVRGVAPHVQS